MSAYIKVKPNLSMQFDPAPWNDPAAIEKRNCMTYALNATDDVGVGMGQYCARAGGYERRGIV